MVARFEAILVNPKPVRRMVPIVLGGSSDAAPRAWAARCGDGWCGLHRPGVDEVRKRVEVLRE